MSLRVMMIAPTPFFGDRGCHVRILEEIRALESADVHVRLITYPAGKDVPGVDARRIPSPLDISRERVGPDYGKFLLDVGMFVACMKNAASFRPDVIHGHLHEGALLGYATALAFRRPLVFDYQGSLSGEMAHHGFITPGSLMFALFHRLETFINDLPAAVLVSSGVMMRDKRNVAGVKWRRVPDAVDLDMFSPLPRDERLFAELALPGDRPVCVFLGLLNRYQGLDLLISAVAEMKRRHGTAAHFLVMGYPGVEHYRGIAERAGIGGLVTFTGRIPYEDAPRYLRLGDFAVAPKIASTESNGKLVDYMACGLPSIALDTAVNREILGDTGVYVPWHGRENETAVSLADEFARVAGDSGLRKTLADQARERAVAHFGRESLMNRLMDTYERITKS